MCGAKITPQLKAAGSDGTRLATSERGGAERHSLGHPNRWRAAIAVMGSSERDGGAIAHHADEAVYIFTMDGSLNGIWSVITQAIVS